MFKVIIEGKEYTYKDKITLVDIVEKLGVEAYAASVNNTIRELNYYIDDDAEVRFLDLTDFEAVRIYETSLRYLVIMAIENLYPKAKIKFNQCVSRSMACTISGAGLVDSKFIEIVEKEMRRIVKLDLPINRYSISKKEAIAIYSKKGYEDKLEILKYREEDNVNMYKCRDYVNYLYGYMVPSTGYLKNFKLSLYYPGFIIQYPRAENKGAVPQFEASLSYGRMLRDAEKWSRTISSFDIAHLNEQAKTKKVVDLVSMCEIRHTNMLSELGKLIKNDIDNIRLICIAGPSSSGKTTFSHRLRLQLMSRGINPVKISMDDYYLDRDDAPKNEEGKPDLEHVEALDLQLFNEHLLALIEGQEVTMPKFNFKTGKREWGEKLKVSKDSPIIIEGIHALNEEVTKLIPKHQKYKIYISPAPQINIDNHTPISPTELRLLRRIVRDNKFRKTNPADTIAMWPNVRRGEFKWIYPFQDEADYIFNTELGYELGVMKKYAIKALKTIDRKNPYFVPANRILKYLKYVVDIDDKYVPCDSLLREFIGGSCYEEL